MAYRKRKKNAVFSEVTTHLLNKFQEPVNAILKFDKGEKTENLNMSSDPHSFN